MASKFFVGTNAGKVYSGSWNGKELSIAHAVNAGKTPSWVSVDEGKKKLYVADESSPGNGCLLTYEIAADAISLKQTKSQSTGFAGPCHVALAEKEGLALVANYSGGGFSVLSIGEAGSDPLQKIDMSRQSPSNPAPVLGPNKGRQEMPHPHMMLVRNNIVYGCDLGQDRIFLWEIKGKSLVSLANATVHTKPGSGPRHMVFHPSHSVAYVANELDCTVAWYDIAAGGSLKEHSSTSTLTAEATFEGTTVAEIIISSDGKNLYVTNRGGSDTIAHFRIDSKGHPTDLKLYDTKGKVPRHIAFDPQEKCVIVSNQQSDRLDAFKKLEDGSLEWASTVQVSKPTCVAFLD